MTTSEVTWVAQHDARASEPLKVVGYNENGTVNLSRVCSVAGEDVKAIDCLLLLDADQSVFIRDC